PRETPLDRLGAVQVQPIRQGLGDVEVATGNVRSLVDHLRQDLAPLVANVELDAAGKYGMRNAFGRLEEGRTARRAPAGRGRSVRRGPCGVVAVLRAGHADGGGKLVLRARVAMIDRERRDRGDQGDPGQPGRALGQRHVHATLCSTSPNDSRTRASKSAGRGPAGPANSRRYIRRYERSSFRATSSPPWSRAARSSSQRFHSRGLSFAGRKATTRPGSSGSVSSSGSGSGASAGTATIRGRSVSRVGSGSGSGSGSTSTSGVSTDDWGRATTGGRDPCSGVGAGSRAGGSAPRRGGRG